MEFHISRQARDKFQFDETLFALDGNVLFADLYAVRLFAQKINQHRDLVHFPEQTARAGQINALGLMDEIFHFVIFLFRQQKNPQLIPAALTALEQSCGPELTDRVLSLFLNEFPPQAVYKKEITAHEYLENDTKGTPNRELILEEMILFWVTRQNPALQQYTELFDSPLLTENRDYLQVCENLQAFFEKQPTFGPENLTLLNLLRSPAVNVPQSLTGQLEYIRDHWAAFLGDYFYRLLTSLDLLKEENKLAFGGPGPVPIPVYDIRNRGGSTSERVAFSQDRDWMPGLVLTAKNTYVWLDQLSQKYQRPIIHLDQIPQAELNFLAQSGITGLWLIGLWERSQASARIKQLCGNPEAIASAYSLYSYEIASDLGGYDAYTKLRDAAALSGIRLASDMVPNHMGIDSDWVMKHPERFLSLDQCPYPNYTFSGPDLSSDPNVTVQIEDHYYDRSDAAVVFKRYEHQNGQTKYIYHGNDGTSMPWNDTAQLNYLDPQVQEVVYQTILDVARKFPIIRFDAAMTLARKQIQRLWFPEPGSGGAIPSRAEHSMTNAQFEAAMPAEFWRMVVDRMAVDAPDTLLLAEAFWMMEGYFVRTLGMHRVYNSAFMHMLRDENNACYRQLLKNTLEFEPEILKRYVNFMNNPDERTAVDQFGKGDKYFGVCTLLATFPGLPMFGHGQIEGFAEKYGMEYRHAYMQETVDESLVERHRREIFPLLQKRTLFAGVENFWLFDFFTTHGHVNENVFAFTNAKEDQHTLVIVNNSLHSSEGWLKISSARLLSGDNSSRAVQSTLGECLGLAHTQHEYLLFRDQSTGLQYIRRTEDILNNGFHIQLKGYEHHAYYDFRVVSSDSKHDYRRLLEYLGEGGIPSIEFGMAELFIQPVLQPYKEMTHPGYLNYLSEQAKNEKGSLPSGLMNEAESKMKAFLRGIEIATNQTLPEKNIVLPQMLACLKATLTLRALPNDAAAAQMKKLQQAAKFLTGGLNDLNQLTLFAYSFIGQIGSTRWEDPGGLLSQAWAEEWQLYKIFADALTQMNFGEAEVARSLKALKLITNQQDWYERLGKKPLREIATTWFATPEILDFLQVNRFEDILWYNREAFAEFIWWMAISAQLHCEMNPQCTWNAKAEILLGSHEVLKAFLKADQKSEFQLEKLLEKLKE